MTADLFCGLSQERLISSTDPMVCAILDGTKTETRRVIHPQPGSTTEVRFPFRAGDLLHVCEVHAIEDLGRDGQRVVYRSDRFARYVGGDPKGFWLSSDYKPKISKWRKAQLMPRELSRITLEVLSIHCERLWDITEDGARAEGVQHTSAFALKWDAINGARGFGWETNPWVFVVKFRRRE